MVSPSRTWINSTVSKVTQNEDNQLKVEWSDGHKSEFNIEMLMESIPVEQTPHFTNSLSAMSPVSPEFRTTRTPLTDVVVPYQEFMGSDKGVSDVLRSLVEAGFGVISNVAGMTETKLALDRISHPIRTIFGDGAGVVEPDPGRNDSVYAHGPLTLHTDTTFFTEPIGYII